MLDQPHFKHYEGNSTFITPSDWPKVDELINWLIDKNRSGYKMVNSVARLEQMKQFMRGQLQDWNCRAGQNSPDHSDGRQPGAMFPDVLGWVQLGRG